MDFNDWQWNYGDSLQSSEVPKVKKAYLAGAASRQQEVEKLQTEINTLQSKYNAMYNAFVVTDDARKEWHTYYMEARKREDALQEMIDKALETLENSDEISHQMYRKVYKILKGEVK